MAVEFGPIFQRNISKFLAAIRTKFYHRLYEFHLGVLIGRYVMVTFHVAFQPLLANTEFFTDPTLKFLFGQMGLNMSFHVVF